MVILGLTGSIGMGKSTAAEVLRRLGVPVHDADRAVHRLLGRGGKAVAAVAAAFPGTVQNGAVDRKALGALVFADKAALARLESIVHPLVRAAKDRFLRLQAARGARLVVLDIPLLFESGGARDCDAVLVVSAPARIQLQRVLGRPGMSRARLDAIRAQQMPDADKRRRATFVIETGLGKRESLRVIAEIVKVMKRRRGRHWPPRAQLRRLRARGRSER
jgi:dephospho-CoA kinase